MNKILYIFILLCILNTAFAQPSPPWDKKISPALLEKSNEEHLSFLILLKTQADVSDALKLDTKNDKGKFVFETLKEVAGSSQQDLLHLLQSANVPHHSLFIINAIRAEGNKELIYELAARTDVAKILDEPVIRYPEPSRDELPPSSRSQLEWGIERINANDVWELGFRGQGVVVGGEDTGYEWTHPALKRQYRGYDSVVDTVNHNYNWHDAIHTISHLSPDSLNPCGLDSKIPCDDGGHGTHTMGTMIGLDSTNEIGVAPEAKWCGCRNMERGWGTPFTYIECFQWFLAPTDLNNKNPDPALAPHVINNSWSCPEIEGCDSSNWEVMNQVVNILRLAGIVVVVSAGNSGPACSTVSAPAAMYEGSFTVGAVSLNDTVAGFSSRGPVAVDSSFRLKPNVSAPGVFIRSASLDSGYVHLSGTSMAGPHVAGLVALIISANPALAGKVDIIEDIIEQTSVPKTTDQECGSNPGMEVPNNTYGYGRVDALAAVEAALALIEVSTEEESETSTLVLYPNPVRDQLYIKLEHHYQKTQFAIYDTHGKLVVLRNYDVSDPLIRVNVSQLPSGIYFYKILSGISIKQGKLIKS